MKLKNLAVYMCVSCRRKESRVGREQCDRVENLTKSSNVSKSKSKTKTRLESYLDNSISSSTE